MCRACRLLQSEDVSISPSKVESERDGKDYVVAHDLKQNTGTRKDPLAKALFEKFLSDLARNIKCE